MSMAVTTEEIIQDPDSMRGLFNGLPDYLVDNYIGPQTWLGGRARYLPKWMFVNSEPVITQGRPPKSGLIDNTGKLNILGYF